MIRFLGQDLEHVRGKPVWSLYGVTRTTVGHVYRHKCEVTRMLQLLPKKVVV